MILIWFEDGSIRSEIERLNQGGCKSTLYKEQIRPG